VLVHSRVWEIDGGANIINEFFDNLRQIQYNHWAELSDRAANSKDPRIKQYSQDRLAELCDFHQGMISTKGTKERENSFNKVRTQIKQLTAAV
jgi:hypothetical protein